MRVRPIGGRIERGDEAQRLAAGHPVVEAGLLGEVADLAPVAGTGRDGDARDRRRVPLVGGVSPASILMVVDLPGAVGAEEAVDGTGRDVER